MLPFSGLRESDRLQDALIRPPTSRKPRPELRKDLPQYEGRHYWLQPRDKDRLQSIKVAGYSVSNQTTGVSAPNPQRFSMTVTRHLE